MRFPILLMAGVSACVLVVIGMILRMKTFSDLNDKDLVVVVQFKIHGIATSRVIQEKSLDSTIADLDQVDQSVTNLISAIKSTLPPDSRKQRALLLEENILQRVHELVLHRKSCENSLHSAMHDPLRDNPLAGGIEFLANQKPALEGKSETLDQQLIRKRMAELEQQNAQVKSSDNTRRRNLFAAGARGRWAETSHRIKSQIFGDLRQLDALMASAML